MDLDAEEEALLGPTKKAGRPLGSTGAHHARPIGPLSKRAIRHGEMRERQETLEDRMEKLKQDREERAGMNISDIHSGVTVAWLCQAFAMDPTTVKKRLADCPPLHRRKAGYVYDLKVAAPFLIKPVFDVKKYLKDMKPSELPSQLQKEYWDAALKRQKWEENAGDLWRTASVLEVLSDTFKMIKTTMQLWTEDLERDTGLTEEQRGCLVGYVDTLQNEISEKLISASKNHKTAPQSGEIVIDDPFVTEPEEDLLG